MCRPCSVEFCACIPADARRLPPPRGENKCVSISDEIAPDAGVFGRADFESVVLRQDDGLKGGPVFVGQLMERLLLCPAALQQGAADHAGRALQAGAEAQGHV